MLSGSFFSIKDQQHSESGLSSIISFHAAHEIFSGHFPGQPVVPGVCMLQIVKELIEGIYKKKFIVQQADQLKFLAVINPEINAEINVDITFQNALDETINLSGKFFIEEMIFFKFKMKLASAAGYY